jgi:8-oxo-dGTP pyrophosphatase MutT (NUDIX family)
MYAGLANPKSMNGMEHAGTIQFLLIRRKDSLRFVDFVRGKYDITDTDYLKQMLGNMTHSERDFLRTTTFEDLWKRVWGSASIRNYKIDYDMSKSRFETLQTTLTEDGKTLLQHLIDTTTSHWEHPEWGFPKGRRNSRESDIECAIREFEEETGLRRDQFKIVQNMEPLCETFYGDNHVHYCHKYYLAQAPSTLSIEMLTDHPHMAREISAIGWFTLDEALHMIRSENIEKREVLLRASGILRNFSPGGGY